MRARTRASRRALIRGVHVRRRRARRRTAVVAATRRLICPMKNEQAGLQSALGAPLNASASASLSLSPSSQRDLFPFFCSFSFNFYYKPFTPFLIFLYRAIATIYFDVAALFFLVFYLLLRTWNHLLCLAPADIYPYLISGALCQKQLASSSISGSQQAKLFLATFCNTSTLLHAFHVHELPL